MAATLKPRLLKRRPIEATVTPLPTDETTPPVTKMNFGIRSASCAQSTAKREGTESRLTRRRAASLSVPRVGYTKQAVTHGHKRESAHSRVGALADPSE